MSDEGFPEIGVGPISKMFDFPTIETGTVVRLQSDDVPEARRHVGEAFRVGRYSSGQVRVVPMGGDWPDDLLETIDLVVTQVVAQTTVVEVTDVSVPGAEDA